MADPRPPRRSPASGAVEAGRRLRLARLAAGLTQTQLAERCEVSRQAVAGAEAGSWSPSLGVALQLARALSTSVDQLFAIEPNPRQASATSLSADLSPARARLASVWGRWVALPLTGDRSMSSGFTAASGRLLDRGEAQVWGSGRSLVIAGCDPALPLMAEAVAVAREGWTVEWWSCANQEALRLLESGLVHTAVLHRPSGEHDHREGSRSWSRIGFASWREGVLLRDNPGAEQPASLAGVVQRKLRWINREPGSGARNLLDRQLAQLGVSGSELEGYASSATGHLQVASAIASGAAEVGIATEPAAVAYGLRFLPLSEEECVFHLPSERLDTPELRLLLAALGGTHLARELAGLPGYDTAILGQQL
ncbi:MAG: substrate-binding domain-containing protein [Candidatus Dormibacteria bacterium]